LDGSNSREAELANVFARLQENGMEAQDLTDNEIAKSHGRFMIGGRAKVTLNVC
jgi:threonine dehydratase